MHTYFRKLRFAKLAQLLVFSLIFSASCSKDTPEPIEPDPVKSFVSAVDISRLPEINAYNPVFYDLNSQQKNMLDILKENGVNTIRIKLWVDPVDGHAGLEEVRLFSQTVKSKGFKTWLTVHYSDTWADPGKQYTPKRWENLGFEALKDSVSAYTKNIVEVLSPDYIQIGNEINTGFLHPLGHINNFTQFKELLDAGIQAVRQASSNTKIIIHYAGFSGANLFYNKLKDLDFEIIGLSYYPWWHGSLSDLEANLTQLSQSYDREVVIAETAYPFTLNWNDWTTNIVGNENQLAPNYPASNTGQQEFIREIRNISWNKVEKGIGFCYWGGEQIAWKGPEGTDASPWENLALFDFNNKALPVLNEFSTE